MYYEARNIPLLQNDAIDALRNAVVNRWEAPIGEVAYIYENTATACLLRKFIIDLLSRSSSPKGEEFNPTILRNFFPADAVEDLLHAVWGNWGNDSSRWDSEDLRELDMCNYHTHEDSVRCKNSIKASESKS